MNMSMADVTDCSFDNNEALTDNGDGSGIYAWESEAHLLECLFTGNNAGDNGGAMSIRNKSTVALSNCDFQDNQTITSGGAVIQPKEQSAAFKIITVNIYAVFIYNKGIGH